MKNEKCFDIGTIQAFVDGELASDLAENIIKHVTLCDSCATLLTETEEENIFAFSAMDDELNCLIPTERLRTKVFESISESKAKESWWSKIKTGFDVSRAFGFKSSGIAAFASVVLLVGLVALGVRLYQPMPSQESVALNDDGRLEEPLEIDLPGIAVSETDDVLVPDDNIAAPPVRTENPGGFRVINAGGISPRGANAKPRNTAVRQNDQKINAEIENVNVPASPNLSGEDSYLQTIATLSRTVDNNKDLILRPTERVLFERDLAVVDDAIKKMKGEVRKNPGNQAAREVLRASYQNKIDLLNSVAEKTELMASIQ